MILRYTLRMCTILLLASISLLLETCSESKTPRLQGAGLLLFQEQQASEDYSRNNSLPSVMELDELVGGAHKGVRQGGQVVSYGADYDPGISDSTSDRAEAIEVEDTSLNLRAYEAGEYTFAIIPQEVGDGAWGGGRDDDVPLQSLITAEVCDFGGGRDDEVPLSYYLGFADYTCGSWRWWGPFAGPNPTVTLNGGDLEDRFKSPTDMLYLAVLTTATGKETSQLPRDGLIAPLPFEPAARAVSQLENPVGVRVNVVTTDIDSGIGTLPQVATGLEAAVGAGNITLTWELNPDPHVTLHQVFRQDLTAGGSVESMGDAPMPTLEYVDTTVVADTTYRYSVKAVNDTGTGGPGETAVGPPIIKTVTPLVGVEGNTVTFAVNLDGSEPFIYGWSFGGGALPNTSADARPGVTLGAVGDYASWVSVDNAYGHDSLDFTLTVKEAIAWRTVTVDPTGDVGWYTSLAEVNGSPAISYYDLTNGDLKFARADNATGGSWGTPLTLDSAGDVGWHTSLAIVNGYPAISYYDVTLDDLKYVRATSADGSIWGAPVTIDSAGFVGEYSSLVVVNGYPAISYYDWTNMDLKYVRAADADGSSWGTPVAVDTEGDVGARTSMAVVNGCPAITYYDNTNHDLKYVRATGADGSSWGTPLTLDSGGIVGWYSSLVVAGGYPAVSYYDWTNTDLKFVRAADADGSSWGTPQIIDGAGDVGLYASMEIIGGNPAVSYFDEWNRELKYVRAGDAYGSFWEAPLVLDSNGDAGFYTSLAEIGGCPAISYEDNAAYDLKFAILR